jgi:HD-GYP domain-containing protein (c-di-GMP phosphodiesterase class II)
MCDRHLTDEEREARPQGAAGFVDEIVVAMVNARIYARGHPRLEAAVDAMHAGLNDLLAEHPGPRVQIGAHDGFVFFEAKPLLGASMAAGRLIGTLGRLGAGGLAFEASTTREEMQAFVEWTARQSKGVTTHEEANLGLDREACWSVRFLPPYREAAGGRGSWTDRVEREIDPVDLSGVGSLEAEIDLDLPTGLYQDVVSALQDAMVQTCTGRDLDTAPALGYVERVLGMLHEDSPGLMRMARYEKYDEFTFGHSIRVCFLALNFARQLTSDQRLLERIGLAALLHDIGKAWVPFEVLHSTGRLDDAQRREMNMHPVHGGQILLESNDPDPLSVAVAFSHHQNLDGTGYPHAIRGGRASAATMIVKIADVYEALTAVRPYKPRMAPTRAYRIMMDMQGYFEPSLLRRFVECNGIYPVGSRVRLTSGEVARVHQLTDQPLAPIVRTETASGGEDLRTGDAETLDLRESFGQNRLRIDGMLLDAEI